MISLLNFSILSYPASMCFSFSLLNLSLSLSLFLIRVPDNQTLVSPGQMLSMVVYVLSMTGVSGAETAGDVLHWISSIIPTYPVSIVSTFVWSL